MLLTATPGSCGLQPQTRCDSSLACFSPSLFRCMPTWQSPALDWNPLRSATGLLPGVLARLPECSAIRRFGCAMLRR